MSYNLTFQNSDPSPSIILYIKSVPQKCPLFLYFLYLRFKLRHFESVCFNIKQTDSKCLNLNRRYMCSSKDW